MPNTNEPCEMKAIFGMFERSAGTDTRPHFCASIHLQSWIGNPEKNANDIDAGIGGLLQHNTHTRITHHSAQISLKGSSTNNKLMPPQHIDSGKNGHHNKHSTQNAEHTRCGGRRFSDRDREARAPRRYRTGRAEAARRAPKLPWIPHK